MRLLARPLAVAEDVRSEEESMAIELLFALLLNVLHTCHPDEAPPEPGRVSEKLAETEALRAILCVMEKEHALELILYVLQQVPSLLPTVTALPTVTLLPSPSYRNPLTSTVTVLPSPSYRHHLPSPSYRHPLTVALLPSPSYRRLPSPSPRPLNRSRSRPRTARSI